MELFPIFIFFLFCSRLTVLLKEKMTKMPVQPNADLYLCHYVSFPLKTCNSSLLITKSKSRFSTCHIPIYHQNIYYHLLIYKFAQQIFIECPSYSKNSSKSWGYSSEKNIERSLHSVNLCSSVGSRK